MSELDKVSAADAIEALDNLDDYARMDVSIAPNGPVRVLLKFIKQNCKPSELADADTMRQLGFLESVYGKV